MKESFFPTSKAPCEFYQLTEKLGEWKGKFWILIPSVFRGLHSSCLSHFSDIISGLWRWSSDLEYPLKVKIQGLKKKKPLSPLSWFAQPGWGSRGVLDGGSGSIFSLKQDSY